MTGQKSTISNAIYARNLGIMQIAVLVEIILSCAIIVENQVTCNAHALKNKTMEVEICSLQVQGGVRIFTRGRGTVGIKKPGPNRLS